MAENDSLGNRIYSHKTKKPKTEKIELDRNSRP